MVWFQHEGFIMKDMKDVDRLRDALAKIAKVAAAAANGDSYSEEADMEEDGASEVVANNDVSVCTPKLLPRRLLVQAADMAVKINPVNAPVFGPLAAIGADLELDVQRIAVITRKYWGPSPRRLTVSFMEATPANLRARLLSHLNAWSKRHASNSCKPRESARSGSLMVQGGTIRISGPMSCSSHAIGRR